MQIWVFSGCWNSTKTDRSHGRKWRSDGRVQNAHRKSRLEDSGRQSDMCTEKRVTLTAFFPVNPRSELIKNEIMFMFKWQCSIVGVIMVGANEASWMTFIRVHWTFSELFVLFACISLNRTDSVKCKSQSISVLDNYNKLNLDHIDASLISGQQERKMLCWRKSKL